MGKEKQNSVQLSPFTTTAIVFVNLDPCLSIATRLRSPAKMIAIPEPTNQSVSVFMCKGNAKPICTTPKRIIIHDTIFINLCTTRLIHLYGWAFYCPVTTKNTTISMLWFENCFAISTFIKVLAGICRHRFFFLKPALRASNR